MLKNNNNKMLKVYTSEDDWRNLPHGTFKTTIMAGNGIFELKNSWLGSSLKKELDYSTVIFPNLEEELIIKNDKGFPKIPKEAILYTIKWYSLITNKNDEEAQINFYYTKGKDSIKINGKERKLKDIAGIKFWTQEIFSYTPLQYNSKTATNTEDPIYTELNKQIGFYIETHSHNSMSAFASGTDLAYSENDAIQLVFGKLNTNEIEMHSWVTIRGITKEALTEDDLSLYIEMPKYKLKENGKYYIAKSEVDLLEYSADLLTEWDKQIQILPTKFTTYTHDYSKYKYDANQYSLFDTDFNLNYGDNSHYTFNNISLGDRLYEINYRDKDSLNNIVKSNELVFKLTMEDIIDIFIKGANTADYSSKTDDEILSSIYDIFSDLLENREKIFKI